MHRGEDGPDQFPRYEIVTTPGHGHEEEIYEVERDLRELDFDDPDYDERTPRSWPSGHVCGAPVVPATVAQADRRHVGEFWAILKTDADKRAFLMSSG